MNVILVLHQEVKISEGAKAWVTFFLIIEDSSYLNLQIPKSFAYYQWTMNAPFLLYDLKLLSHSIFPLFLWTLDLKCSLSKDISGTCAISLWRSGSCLKARTLLEYYCHLTLLVDRFTEKMCVKKGIFYQSQHFYYLAEINKKVSYLHILKLRRRN